jgi:hypothetical protein
MMASIRVIALRLVIYPNDHGPPHVHVMGPGWELKVRLKEPPELVAVLGKPKTAELAEGLDAVWRHLRELTQMWGRLHD